MPQIEKFKATDTYEKKDYFRTKGLYPCQNCMLTWPLPLESPISESEKSKKGGKGQGGRGYNF